MDSSKVAAYGIRVPKARDKLLTGQNGRPQCLHFVSVRMCLSNILPCMKVGSGGNLGLSREYPKKLSGPLFHSWWKCPLIRGAFHNAVSTQIT